MSLRRLMNCYISVQSAEGANQGVDTDGAVDRSNGWVVLQDYQNIRCNIQERKRVTVTTKYQRHEEEHDIVCYHQNKKLYEYLPGNTQNQTQIRFVSGVDVRTRLVFPASLQTSTSIFIYEFMGHIQQVAHPTKRLYVLKLKRSDRWKL